MACPLFFEKPGSDFDSLSRRLDQASINTEWLIEKIDEMHDILCGDHCGTWQDRTLAVLEAVKKLKGKNND